MTATSPVASPSAIARTSVGEPSKIGPALDLEERLRSAFSVRNDVGYAPEATAEVADGETGEDALDTARLDAAVAQLRVLAGVGEDTAVAEDSHIAAETAEALRRGAAPPPSSRLPLVAELMIISDGTRPAGLIRDGRVLKPSALGRFSDIYIGFLPDIDRTVAATGRIVRQGAHVGTGVLVAAGPRGAREPAVLTARHVALRCRGDDVAIDFRGEVGAESSARFHLGAVILDGAGPGPHGDHCLLALGPAIDAEPVPLSARIDLRADALDAPGQAAVVSYPGRPNIDVRALADDAAWLRAFEGLWHVKRLSPARLLDGGDPALAHHDATTTGGSSGGAVASVGTGRFAGIHLGGVTASRNQALRLAAIARHWPS